MIKESGLARVTAVARRNFDIVNGELSLAIVCLSVPDSRNLLFFVFLFFQLRICASELIDRYCCLDQGIHFNNRKDGNIGGWKPDRCKSLVVPIPYIGLDELVRLAS